MSPKDKLLDYMARRDHSEKELRRKMSKKYSPEEVTAAISWAQERGFIPQPETLSEKVASTLHRKYKGIHFVNQYLRDKGLPPVARDSELELEKARYLVENKSAKKRAAGDEKKAREKLVRFLSARGYDSETIRKVIHEKR